jgi:hypothetical protein
MIHELLGEESDYAKECYRKYGVRNLNRFNDPNSNSKSYLTGDGARMYDTLPPPNPNPNPNPNHNMPIPNG